jgi:hypothetical protein
LETIKCYTIQTNSPAICNMLLGLRTVGLRRAANEVIDFLASLPTQDLNTLVEAAECAERLWVLINSRPGAPTRMPDQTR